MQISLNQPYFNNFPEVKLCASHQLQVTSHQFLITSHQLLVTTHQLLVSSHQLLVSSDQLLVTSHQLVTSCWSLLTSLQLLVSVQQSVVASYWQLASTSHCFLVKSDPSQLFAKVIPSREIIGGVFCLFMLICL